VAFSSGTCRSSVASGFVSTEVGYLSCGRASTSW
jgi:hypothetical protein